MWNESIINNNILFKIQRKTIRCYTSVQCAIRILSLKMMYRNGNNTIKITIVFSLKNRFDMQTKIITYINNIKSVK